MKDVTGVVSRAGNIDTSTARKGSISGKGLGVIMQILSNMYTNAPLAVLREYSCNARDSHIEAGQTRPIEITLPTDLQPMLLIQDFGIGLTEEQAMVFFLEYGESTKRDTDEQVGAFGIGSKSAFTMGHQFTVTAIKDGRKAVLLLALDQNSVLTAQVIRSGETDEPNGVLVSLAVEDVETLRQTAESFFSYWPRGSVLVDGEEPTPIFERGNEINDHTWLLAEHDGQVIVEMGGVPYVVSREIIKKVARDLDEADLPAAGQAKALINWHSATSLLFHVEIGTVDIAPTREGLRDTQRTLDALKALLGDLVDDLAASVQAKVDAAPSLFQASLVMHQAMADLGPFKVGRSQINYVGASIKAEIEIDLPVYFLVKKTWRSQTMVVGEEPKFTVNYERADRVLVVTGVPKGEEGSVRRYAKRFLETFEAEREDSERVKWILVSDQAKGSHDWFEYGDVNGARFMTRDDYRATLRSMRASAAARTNEPSYTTGWAQAERDLGDRDLLSDIIGWGKDIVIFHENSARHGMLTRQALEGYTPVVLLGTQSEDALRKRIAEDGTVGVVENRGEIVKAYARQVFESVTPDERAAFGAIKWLDSHDDYDWRRLGDALGEENITSAAYRDATDTFALARLVAADVTRERRNLLAQVAQHLGSEITFPAYDAEVPSTTEAYPLVGALVERSTYVVQKNDALKAEALAYVNSR